MTLIYEQKQILQYRAIANKRKLHKYSKSLLRVRQQTGFMFESSFEPLWTLMDLCVINICAVFRPRRSLKQRTAEEKKEIK
jgi:hypothetical protein